jgi:hypothetical protein
MTVPVEIVQLQQFVWNHVEDAFQNQQALSAALSLLNQIIHGIWFPIVLALLSIPLIILGYQPRIPRGGLWVPAFGVFGSRPKLYTHSRAGSFFGLFRRTRHRVATRRR